MLDLAAPDSSNSRSAAAYRVLARKYRPVSFAELIGQQALVRTLSNAISTGRLAHAFLLTGVRGVGKTTTARIIARSLTCVGVDGTGGPTIEPCGSCEHCTAIAQDRHLDIIEMDAASRTGIDDVRAIIDGVQYAPVSARYKIYIIDEVHMLSKAAFNGLLKTLEEPPPHVKFVFATTEIRKVPVTVLSRCQRFDLRRVPADVLAGHFAWIAEQEGARLEPDAMALVARAADGSVRDGLSLLDQAIAHAQDAAAIAASEIRQMLGLADRSGIFDLFETLMRGDAGAALTQFTDLYDAGADPVATVQDLLELTHWLTRVKINPADADVPTVPEAERVRGRDLAERLSMAVLTRTWQMLLKGLGEVQQAPAPRLAVDMLLVRLTYAANLPTPTQLVQQLQSTGGAATAPASAPVSASTTTAPTSTTVALSSEASAPPPARATSPTTVSSGSALAVAEPVPVETGQAASRITSFSQLVAWFQERGELVLHAQLWNNVHLVGFRPGRLELRLEERAPPNLAGELASKLSRWTEERWVVTVSGEEGEPTLADQHLARESQLRRDVAEHPLVRAALAAFPGAVIETIRSIDRMPAVEPIVDVESDFGDEADSFDEEDQTP